MKIRKTRERSVEICKKIYCASKGSADRYYLGVTDAGLAFVGSANQSIRELKTGILKHN